MQTTTFFNFTFTWVFFSLSQVRMDCESRVSSSNIYRQKQTTTKTERGKEKQHGQALLPRGKMKKKQSASHDSGTDNRVRAGSGHAEKNNATSDKER